MFAVFHHESSSSDTDDADDLRSLVKVKASASNKGPYDFDLLVPVQDLKRAHHVRCELERVCACRATLVSCAGGRVDDGVLAVRQVAGVGRTGQRVAGVGAQGLRRLLPADA